MVSLNREASAELFLDEEAMRELGYRIVDTIVAHHQTLAAKPVSQVASRAELDAQLKEPVPRAGADPGELVTFLEREVFSHMMYANHPRFFAFVPGPSNFVGAMADALASGYNTIVSEWMEASGPAALELVTLDWLRELCGLPSGAGGLFVSGGSVANLTGLAVAREIKLANRMEKAVLYCSEQTHGSNRKALKILGFQPEQLVPIAMDDECRLDVSALQSRLYTDRAAGLRPFCVIANAGTTNTGAVDPLAELVRLGRAEDLWIHVDGAYGAAAVLTERGARALEGLGEVDSLAIDPHKWLFQPFEIGCVLVRDFNALKQTFSVDHEYLQDIMADAESQEVDFCDVGIQLTRGFRALKLWLTFKTFGLDAIRAAVDRALDLAQAAEVELKTRPHVEVCTPARLGVVTFRYVREGAPGAELDALNLALVQAVIKDGHCMLSSTRLGDQTVLRLCTINPRTKVEDLQSTLSTLDRLFAAL